MQITFKFVFCLIKRRELKVGVKPPKKRALFNSIRSAPAAEAFSASSYPPQQTSKIFIFSSPLQAIIRLHTTCRKILLQPLG